MDQHEYNSSYEAKKKKKKAEENYNYNLATWMNFRQ